MDGLCVFAQIEVTKSWGVVKPLVQFLGAETTIGLAHREALLLAISLLFGGNEVVQRAFLDEIAASGHTVLRQLHRQVLL